MLDGAGWHGGRNLVVPDDIVLLALPPHAPELDPVENVRHYLRSNRLAITVFNVHAAIVDTCRDAWTLFATNPAAVAAVASRS